MERFRASVEARRRGEEPPEDGYHGAYIADLAALRGDPVPLMPTQIEHTLERFRIHYDSWALQSELEQRLPEFPRLDTYEKDGAVWARSSAYGDDDDRVLIRSETGTPTYRAADVVYLADKLDWWLRPRDLRPRRRPPRHAQLVRRGGNECSATTPERVEVLLYQLVHLSRGGEAAKMSKRRGDVVMLDEFLDEVGVDAARWYLVSRGPDQTIEIDADLVAPRRRRRTQSSTSNTPTLGSPGSSATPRAQARHIEPPVDLAAEERDLVKRLAEFPAVVAAVTARRGPHAIPTYAIRVMDDFHRFDEQGVVRARPTPGVPGSA